MVESFKLDCLVEEFKNVYETLKDNFIKREYVINYNMSNRCSFHSILQYVLMRAGMNCSYIPILEYKIHFKKPIDKTTLDERFIREYANKSKKPYKLWQVTVDVAFFRNFTLEGVGEIYTLDQIHGCLPSKDLEKPSVTPYHKLNHIVKYSKNKLQFMICINILPENLDKGRLPWKDSRKYSIKEWGSRWKKVLSDLESEGIKVRLIAIDENGCTLLK